MLNILVSFLGMISAVVALKIDQETDRSILSGSNIQGKGRSLSYVRPKRKDLLSVLLFPSLSTSLDELTDNFVQLNDSIPRVGVAGGFAEYSEVNRKINRKCSKNRCDEIDNSLDSLKVSIPLIEQTMELLNNTSLLQTVVDLQNQINTLKSNLEKVESCFTDITSASCPFNKQRQANQLIQNIVFNKEQVNKVDACFGDITSSNCPASTAGNTGVIAGITANTAASGANTAAVATNTAAVATNTAASAANTACFGDITSTDCPSSTAGKTGVIAGINENKCDDSRESRCTETGSGTSSSLEACFGDITSSDCPASTAGKTGVIAALANKCDDSKCEAIKSTTDKHETCFGDVSSTDCPAAATDKTAVGAGITANIASIEAIKSTTDKHETCFGDVSSTDCPAAATGKTAVGPGITANIGSISAMKTTTDKHETCFGDVSSTDCPDAATDKTGVGAGITANIASIEAIKSTTDKHETCFGDASSTDCPDAAAGKTAVGAGITAIKTTTDKHETCFGDVSSTECPDAAVGKTAIGAGITANIASITSLEEPPIFNCELKTDKFNTKGVLKPFTSCGINEDSIVDKATGFFKCTKAGKYRLTFTTTTVVSDGQQILARMVLAPMDGGSWTIIGKSSVQDADTVAVEITTTIDIIYKLMVGDRIGVQFHPIGDSPTGYWTSYKEIIFSGNYLRA